MLRFSRSTFWSKPASGEISVFLALRHCGILREAVGEAIGGEGVCDIWSHMQRRLVGGDWVDASELRVVVAHADAVRGVHRAHDCGMPLIRRLQVREHPIALHSTEVNLHMSGQGGARACKQGVGCTHTFLYGNTEQLRVPERPREGGEEKLVRLRS